MKTPCSRVAYHYYVKKASQECITDRTYKQRDNLPLSTVFRFRFEVLSSENENCCFMGCGSVQIFARDISQRSPYVGVPLWSSGQSSWLQIRRPRFDFRHYQKKK
jgi:hypothetical protein